ncbi:MAG: hypothetical protein IKU16_00320 [Muribaculaceae bacterium]|nr:hypothetical protein [Muribaculaceae bacterium]
MNYSGRHIFRLASLCVVVLTMVGALSSCSRYAGDEAAVGSALAMADSLRYDSPEAADSIIRSLDADSLGSRANSALYALLANEVNIYVDQVAVADSLADIATDYYRMRRWQSERNRYLYARAMIQKADVSVDCKDYKKAIEIISDVWQSIDGEYYDLIAKSYMVFARISFIKNESPSERIKLLKSAAENYARVRLKYMQAEILNTLGGTYRIVHDMDSAFYYLSEAGVMIDSLDKPKLKAANLAYIAGGYYLNKEYDKAISTAKRAISVADNLTDMSEPKYVVCKSYLSKNDLDSAMIMLRDVKFDTLVPKEKLMHLSIMLSIAKVKEDYQSALDYQEKMNVINHKLINESRDESMLSIQRQYEKSVLESVSLRQQRLILFMVLVVILLAVILCYQIKKSRRQAVENQLFIEELQTNIDVMRAAQALPHKISQQEVEQTVDNVEKFDSLYRSYLCVCSKLDEISQYVADNGQNISMVKAMIADFSKDKKVLNEFLELICIHVNNKYDHLLDRLKCIHPSLSEGDVQLMALIASGYTTAMMVSCFGFSSRASIDTKKNRLKKKLGINCSIADYINSIKSNE